MRWLAMLCVLGGAVPLAVHVATYSGDSTSDLWKSSGLFILGGFVFVGLALLHAAIASASGRPPVIRLDTVARAMPTDAMIVFIASFSLLLYFAFTLASTAVLTEAGYVERREDTYLLYTNHGQHMREISYEQFRRFRVYEVRGATDFALPLYFVPAAYFYLLHRERHLPDENATNQREHPSPASGIQT